MMETKNIIILVMSLLIIGLLIFGINNISELKEVKEQEIEDYKLEIEDYKLEIEDIIKIQEDKIASMSAIDYYPTFNEVMEVVNYNTIENREYDEESFACVEFSNNLVRAFRDAKIYSCATELWFDDDTAHANVAIETSDKGLIYIEPQDDSIIFDLEVGEDYCKKVDWDCNWEITHIKSCYS